MISPRILSSLFSGVFFLAVSAQAASVVLPNSVDLFNQMKRDTFQKTPATVHADNLNMLAAFLKEDGGPYLTNDSHGRPTHISPKDAQHVFEEAGVNEVAGLHMYSKYDPDNRGIGFCFGRAMFVHLELAQHKFNRNAIKKAFVVGPMTTGGGTSWGWHVTTIVQSLDRDGKEVWLTIDPITAAPMPVAQWYAQMYTHYSTDKLLKLYITDATRFGPSPLGYDHRMVGNEFYNRYFDDMNVWFDKESHSSDHYKAGTEFKEYNLR